MFEPYVDITLARKDAINLYWFLADPTIPESSTFGMMCKNIMEELEETLEEIKAEVQ